jgi:hypothetical protein
LLGSFCRFQRLLTQGGQDGIQAWVQVLESIQDRSGNFHRRYIPPTNLFRDVAQRAQQQPQLSHPIPSPE